MDLTLVDTSDRVVEMADFTASGVGYLGDAWEYADELPRHRERLGRRRCDTFTGDPMTRSLAEPRAVVLARPRRRDRHPHPRRTLRGAGRLERPTVPAQRPCQLAGADP